VQAAVCGSARSSVQLFGSAAVSGKAVRQCARSCVTMCGSAVVQ
jgi:hypothetical protein